MFFVIPYLAYTIVTDKSIKNIILFSHFRFVAVKVKPYMIEFSLIVSTVWQLSALRIGRDDRGVTENRRK